MDKKVLVIVGVLVALLVGLLVWAFVADAKDNVIITINDIGYDKAGFENYYKLKYVEETKTASESASEDDSSSSDQTVDKEELKVTALNEYATYLIINKEAMEKGFKLSDEDIKSIEDEYDAEDFDKEAYSNLGVTREDYINTKKFIEVYNQFVNDAGEYYDVPQSTIDSYYELNKDLIKGIDFRVMNFNITNTEATTNDDGEEVPATSNKDEVVAKAQEILDKVRAGEDFETLAKENADQRYVYTKTELKQVNGELESCDLPYLQSYFMFSCSDLVEPLKALENVGDYTELITTDNNVMFARLEAVRDDIEEDTRNDMDKSIRQSVGQSYLSDVVQSSQVILNSKLLKSIKI